MFFYYFFFLVNWPNFDCKLVVSLFSQSIIFWFNSFSNKDIFNFLSIIWSNISWIISTCSFFISKIYQCIRSLSIKYQFTNSWIYLFKLLCMSWPVRSWKEKVFKCFLWTFWNEFCVSEWFVVTCVINYCWKIYQDLIYW